MPPKSARAQEWRAALSSIGGLTSGGQLWEGLPLVRYLNPLFEGAAQSSTGHAVRSLFAVTFFQEEG